jgi:taurine--2-oxoglutarate transaminase
MVRSARGVYVTSEDGIEYLDFSSQSVFTNMGHQHPYLVRAIKEQADILATISPQHGYVSRYRAAEAILDHSFKDASKVFFTNGGADAVEHAVRMARLHTGRHKVLSQYRSYHGGTAAAINLTGDPRRWPSDGSASGVIHFFGPYLYRSPFSATNETEECERSLKHLEDTIRFEGPDNIAAILLETIPGAAGVITPPADYLRGVRELCNHFGIVYIADEVMSGFGRSGSWFAYELYDVEPDLVVFAKGVNSGYLPLGGVIISDAIASTFDHRVYPGGLTYSGHPLACAVTVAAIEAMESEMAVENARRIGDDVLRPGLLDLAKRHPSVGDVRGMGVFFCLELVSDRSSKKPLTPYGPFGDPSVSMSDVTSALRAEGLLVYVSYHRLLIVPPCIISDEEAREGLARLDRALTRADQYYDGDI